MSEDIVENIPLKYKLESIEELANSIIEAHPNPDGSEPCAEVCLAYETKFLLKLFLEQQEIINGKAIQELGVSDMYLEK